MTVPATTTTASTRKTAVTQTAPSACEDPLEDGPLEEKEKKQHKTSVADSYNQPPVAISDIFG